MKRNPSKRHAVSQIESKREEKMDDTSRVSQISSSVHQIARDQRAPNARVSVRPSVHRMHERACTVIPKTNTYKKYSLVRIEQF